MNDTAAGREGDNMIFAGILAGGTGSRMGADMPKQFLELEGVPVLIRTVEVFRRAGCFDRVFVAVTPGWESYARDLINKSFPGEDAAEVVTGGSDRTGSILCVIDAIKRIAESRGEDADGMLLVTHDAARPFATVRMILDSIEAAEKDGCAGAAVPSVDTVFSSADGRHIDDIPPRSGMFCMQTPQTFRIGLFTKALASLERRQRDAITDACGIFIRAGMKACFVRGDRSNIKITEPSDMALARTILDSADK